MPHAQARPIAARRLLVAQVRDLATGVGLAIRTARALHLPVEPGVAAGRDALIVWAHPLDDASGCEDSNRRYDSYQGQGTDMYSGPPWRGLISREGRSGQDQLGGPEYIPANLSLWLKHRGKARSAPQQPVISPAT